jgi:branched-chain amino acid transport system permease protein
MQEKTRNAWFLLGLSALLLFGLSALIYLGVIDEYTAQIISLGSINVVIALSLNLVSGFCGQLALGQAGFMAIGAYTAAFFTMQLKLPLAVGIVAGGFVSAVFGFLVGFPALRLRGDYLAIVTLGFGEIIRVILINIEGLTGGAAGLKGIPSFTRDILLQPAFSFFFTLLAVIIAVTVVKNLLSSSYGRAIMSVREDEIASGSVGIPVFRYKMAAFMFSAFIAGVGGGLYAPFFGYLNPTMFNFLKSVDFLIIVVMGGMGSVAGTVIAGYALTYLQEFLRFLKDYRLVIYSLLLVVIMIYRPSGLMGKREWSPASFFLEWLPAKIRARSGQKTGKGA